MNIKLSTAKASSLETALRVIPVREGSETGNAVRELGRELRARVEERAGAASFRAKQGSSLLVQDGRRDIVLAGLGREPAAEDWRRAAAAGARAATETRAQSVALCLGRGAGGRLEAAVEGFVLASYRYDKYRSDTDDAYAGATQVVVAGSDLGTSDMRRRLARTLTVCEATASTRDLINEMSSVKTPSFLVATARRLARGSGLSCTVWQGDKLRREKMNGILRVSAGSDEPGAFIKLVYRPKRKARARVALVGKGITFDSGGLSLKPAKHMEWMKQDMSGAAAVLGTMQAVAALKPAVEVRGYIAAAENMPGSGAQKPGDIIRYRNGKTAEVLNTDAEGRLVLADALCVAAEQEPDCIIDLATLTGACMVALGSDVAGIMGNDAGLIGRLIKSGRRSGDRLWELPLIEDYMADIRSSTADIQNIGSGYAGTITAALFLRCFVGEAKWAHLDIAGPAFAEKPKPYCPKGGTGFGVRLLTDYIFSL